MVIVRLVIPGLFPPRDGYRPRKRPEGPHRGTQAGTQVEPQGSATTANGKSGDGKLSAATLEDLSRRDPQGYLALMATIDALGGGAAVVPCPYVGCETMVDHDQFVIHMLSHEDDAG